MQIHPVKTRVLALMRHGEYEQPRGVPSAHLPHPLTDVGREQARRGARESAEFAARQGLSIEPIIDCSRTLRAWQTADLLRDELAKLGHGTFCIAEFEELAERSLGAAANLSLQQIEDVLRADPRVSVPPAGWKRDPSYKLPLEGAESLDEAGSRVARHVLGRSRATRAGSLKLFVGHGGAFRHAACALGVLSREQVAHLTLRHGAAVYLEHRFDAEVDRLTHLAGEWQTRSETSSLD
jgi:broad specificity phosphatase PhoE